MYSIFIGSLFLAYPPHKWTCILCYYSRRLWPASWTKYYQWHCVQDSSSEAVSTSACAYIGWFYTAYGETRKLWKAVSRAKITNCGRKYRHHVNIGRWQLWRLEAGECFVEVLHQRDYRHNKLGFSTTVPNVTTPPAICVTTPPATCALKTVLQEPQLDELLGRCWEMIVWMLLNMCN